MTEGDNGQLKSSYRRQLLLYARLEQRATPGNPPSRLAVIPLKGDPLDFEIDWAEVESTVAEAGQLIDSYNAHCDDAQAIARPSPASCGSCQYAATCPAMWDAAEAGWSPYLIAIAGTLKEVMRASDGSVTLRVTADGGTISSGDIVIKRLSPATCSDLADAHAGQEVRFVGGRLADGEPDVVSPSAWARLDIS